MKQSHWAGFRNEGYPRPVINCVKRVFLLQPFARIWTLPFLLCNHRPKPKCSNIGSPDATIMCQLPYTEVTVGSGLLDVKSGRVNHKGPRPKWPERGLMGVWSKHTRVISLTARVRLIQRPPAPLPSRRRHLSCIPALASNEKVRQRRIGLRRHVAHQCTRLSVVSFWVIRSTDWS